MHQRHLARTTSSRLMSLALLWFGIVLYAPQVQASTCKLACKGGPCSVKASPLSEEKPQSQPREQAWTEAKRCDLLQVETGLVELRYLHRGRWFMPPPQKPPKLLGEIFKTNPADICSVITPACLQQALNAKQAAVGGHGIDNRVSMPGGDGNPCSLGLPCGSVMPGTEPLTLRLLDRAAKGQLSVRTARGQAAETQATVQDGKATLAAGWLQPGGLYVYHFIDAAGKPVASGEFSMLSASMAERLRQRAAQRQEQQALSAAQAWYDTLLENQLLWDALQLDLGSDS